MKTYKIYFIRNALTAGSLEGKYIGHTDEHICSEGEKQLRDLLNTAYFPETHVVFSSPLKRCTETSNIIYPDKDPIIMNDLIECNFGEFEGKTVDDLKDDEEFKRWLRGENGAYPPFGESTEEFTRRVCLCFINIVNALITEGITKAAIVTHGGVIMTLLAAFGLPEAHASEWRTPSGCGYAALVTPQIWSRIKKFEVVDEIPYVDPPDERHRDSFDNDDVFDFYTDESEENDEYDNML